MKPFRHLLLASLILLFGCIQAGASDSSVYVHHDRKGYWDQYSVYHLYNTASTYRDTAQRMSEDAANVLIKPVDLSR